MNTTAFRAALLAGSLVSMAGAAHAQADAASQDREDRLPCRSRSIG
jgi:hypothetical protein